MYVTIPECFTKNKIHEIYCISKYSLQTTIEVGKIVCGQVTGNKVLKSHNF